MFYYVSGTVAHVEPYLAVIDCGGVGYACKTTNTTLESLWSLNHLLRSISYLAFLLNHTQQEPFRQEAYQFPRQARLFRWNRRSAGRGAPAGQPGQAGP